MNIRFEKLASDRVALLALKMSLPLENRRSTASLDRIAVLNFRAVSPRNVRLEITKRML